MLIAFYHKLTYFETVKINIKFSVQWVSDNYWSKERLRLKVLLVLNHIWDQITRVSFCYCYSALIRLISFCIFRLLVCSKGYFGKNCLRKCSPYCKPDTCQHTDGWCNCSSGWTGDNCTKCNYQWSLRNVCSLFIVKCKNMKKHPKKKFDL